MTSVSPIAQPPDAHQQQLRQVAQKLETAFLSEMLKAAGVGKPSEAFGGGAGEEHFASFLRDAQAERMVAAGGIGLAETFFNALKDKENAQ
ncbi:hypothetical protein E7681_09425 [Thalassobius vesicularis]|uniref:Flagellar protein FlgJ N-terminal domain-containing protein n=1 Tax=Thalassobius vesicularis TaxID=1294297 RepID=A0A4S3MBE2_9RHOB|nr:rod-binding protein [Thalassobius vesicularis]THD73826.1 hypothetical protein E7681_09425 [Thalassobius vesicularis]